MKRVIDPGYIFSYPHLIPIPNRKKASKARKMNHFATTSNLKEEPNRIPEEMPGRSSDDMPSAEAVSYPNHTEDMLQTSSQHGRKSPPRRSARASGRLDRTTIMIIVIIGMTMITQIPVCFVYGINYFLFWDDSKSRIHMPDYIDILLHWLLLLNSAADPVIYGLMNPPFRRAYLKFINSLRYIMTKRTRDNTVTRNAESYLYK